VWGAYAVGTPWKESAPLDADLESYGAPLDVRVLQAELKERGHELTVREIELVRPEDSAGLLASSSLIVRAKVDFGGRTASVHVYPDVTSKREDWGVTSSLAQPRDLGPAELLAYDLDNVMIFESGWSPSGLGGVLQDLDR